MRHFSKGQPIPIDILSILAPNSLVFSSTQFVNFSEKKREQSVYAVYYIYDYDSLEVKNEKPNTINLRKITYIDL